MSTHSLPISDQKLGQRSVDESVLDMGTGNDAVVFLHGLFGTPDHWLTIMEELCGTYRCVAPPLPVDRRPGRRQKGARSIGELTCEIARIIDALQLNNFVLCGNSLGGLVAIDYCLRHPTRPVGLVLAGSAGLYERSVTNGAKPKATREFVRTVISDIFYNPVPLTDELIEEWYESVRDRDYARFILRISRATRDRCVEDELGELSLPTMIAWGRNDEITPPHVAESFKSRIRGAQLRYIDNCGHAPSLEQPEALTAILNDFLPSCFDPNGNAEYRR